jgi:hypothetical protein
MTLLLSRIGVFAAFFKYLSAFGTKSFPQDEGFTGFDSRISTNENGEVICLGSLSSANSMLRRILSVSRVMLSFEVCR